MRSNRPGVKVGGLSIADHGVTRVGALCNFDRIRGEQKACRETRARPRHLHRRGSPRNAGRTAVGR